MSGGWGHGRPRHCSSVQHIRVTRGTRPDRTPARPERQGTGGACGMAPPNCNPHRPPPALGSRTPPPGPTATQGN